MCSHVYVQQKPSKKQMKVVDAMNVIFTNWFYLQPYQLQLKIQGVSGDAEVRGKKIQGNFLNLNFY